MNFFRKYWVYILIATLPFERIPSLRLPLAGHDVTVRLSYIVAIIALIVFSPQLLAVIKKLKLKDPRIWLAGYLFVTVLSSFGAASRTKALVAIIATAITIGAGILVSTVKPIDNRLVQKTLAVVTLVVCLFGLYQFLGDSFGLSPTWTGLRDIYTKRVFGFPRVQATALEPLFLGNFLLIPLILSFASACHRQIDKLTGWLLLLIALTITLTLSRGAFFASIAALAGFTLLAWAHISKRRLLLAVGLTAAGCLLALGMIFTTTKLTQPNNGGNRAIESFAKQSTTVRQSPGAADGDREVNRKLAINAFKSRPVLGWGIGNFGTYAEAHNPAYATTYGAVTVNNEYLEVLAETGVAGMLALIGFFIALLWQVLSVYFRFTGSNRVWIVALSVIVGGFIIQYYAFSTLYVMHIWVVLGLLMGAVQAADQNHDAAR